MRVPRLRAVRRRRRRTKLPRDSLDDVAHAHGMFGAIAVLATNNTLPTKVGSLNAMWTTQMEGIERVQVEFVPSLG
jgi:hypothetical protein